MEYLHNFIIINEKIIRNLPIKNQGSTVIYEVIRISEGVPLFLEKHLQRLITSAKISNKNIPFSVKEFQHLIENLVFQNKIQDGNIKISLEYDQNKDVNQSVIGFIPHTYPSPEEYREGVKTITSINLRINPKAKVQNDKLRSELNILIKVNDAYEAILVHPGGYITEGSRSNIFFVKGNSLITSPDDQVLSGITRENIIRICKENNYRLILQSLKYSELASINAAFITGTSPKVLPIRSIDNIIFKLPNKLIQEIMLKYNKLIHSYVASYQKNIVPDN